MSFFIASRRTANPSTSTRTVRTALTFVAMSAALGFAAAPAAAAEAVVTAQTMASMPMAPLEGIQSATIYAAPQAPIVADEYLADSPQAAVAMLEGGGIRWPYPFAARVNDAFGPRSAPCSGCSSFHDGLDLGGGDGTPIQSIADGVVVTATNDGGGLGSHVEIQHVIGGRVITSLYAHMQYGSLGLTVGESVAAGQYIGLTGSTGQSTGPHLHLELYYEDGVRIDPAAWLYANAAI